MVRHMAENNFLSGIKVDQFIKANNAQIKETIGAAFGDAQKSVAELIKLQKITVLELQQINNKGKGKESKELKKSLDSTLRSIQKENIKMSKARDSSIIKSLKGFFGKSKQNAEVKKESRDYFKKENYSKKSNSLLESINKGIGGLMKKEKKEKKGLMGQIVGALFGALGFLGKALAIGGLAGFLLTGKKEFLFSVAKGLNHMAKAFFGTVKLIFKLPQILGKVFNAVKGIAKVGTTLAKLPKMMSTAMKTVGTTMKVVQKLGLRAGAEHLARMGAKTVGRTLGSKVATSLGKTALGKKAVIAVAKSGIGKKIGAKVGSKAIATGLGVAGKVAAHTAGKTAAKKVPILGAVMGVAFGVMRIKKGDIVGGLLEFASGIASIFPGVGTAISVGIDGILLAKDINSALKSKSTSSSGGGSTSIPKPKSSGGNIGDAYGGGSTKKIKKPQPKNLAASGVMGKIKGLLFSKPVFKDDKKKEKTGLGAMSFGGVGSNLASAVGSAEGVGGKLTAAGGVAAEVFNNAVKGSDGAGWRKANSGVDVSGINPAIWHNFIGMAQEYAQKGGVIDITSGSRSPEKQKALYAEAVRTGRTKYVAKPGRSMHEFGYAIDMDRGDGNALDRMGLLSKWHFARPMPYEPWHTELAGLKGQYDAVRSGKMKYGGEVTEKPNGGVKGNVGDAYSMMKKMTPRSVPIPKDLLGGGMDAGISKVKEMIPSQLADKANLPLGNIANKIQNSKPMQVILGASDINTLATAIGEAMKKALPTPKNNYTPVSGGGRGSV